MNTKALNSLAELICRAQENGKRTPMGIAMAIDSAQRHMSPETAAELERLRARVAELEAERHSTNESLADMTEALRAAQAPSAQQKPDPRGCQACGSLPEQWCPDCAACQEGCFEGFAGNDCTHANARWRRPSVEASADKLTRMLAPTQALRETDTAGGQ